MESDRGSYVIPGSHFQEEFDFFFCMCGCCFLSFTSNFHFSFDNLFSSCQLFDHPYFPVPHF